MAAKFQFFPISAKTVGLTKITTMYIIQEHKILYKTDSIHFFAMNDCFIDIEMFYLLLSSVLTQMVYILRFFCLLVSVCFIFNAQ